MRFTLALLAWLVPALATAQPAPPSYGPQLGAFCSLSGCTMTGALTINAGAGTTFTNSGAATITGLATMTGGFSAGAASSTSGTNTFSIGSSIATNSILRGTPATGGNPFVLTTLGPTGAIGLNINLQNASGGADGLLQVLNPVKIAPSTFAWSGAYQPAFFESVTLSGTATGAGASVNQYTIGDSVDGSALSTAMTGFNILHNYGGGTTKGGRVGFEVSLVQQNGANADGSADNFYVGAAFYSFGRYGQSGATAAAPLGRIFGFNAVSAVQTGFVATNLFQVAGGEINFGISSGSSSFIRSGLTLADLNGTAQGFGGDNALWFYGGGVPLRNSIMWGDTQVWSVDATVGAMLNANIGSAGYNARPLQAKWGVKFDQVIFPSTGNSYDGGFFATNGASMDGAGTLRLGATYFTSSSAGLAIDAKGSVGNGVSIGTPGTGYTPGTSTVVVTAFGGYWLVNVNGGGIPTAVSALVQPQWPSTSSPPATATPTALNPLETGTGLVLNVTWDTTATTLALQPSGGPTTVGSLLRTAASTTSSAGINVAQGTPPTSPNNGDLWATSSTFNVRINGTTYNLLAGSAAASITPGTTTVIGATAPCVIANTASTVMGCVAETGTGSVVLATSPSIASPTVTGAFTATGLVTNGDLANNTISGIALGSNLATLTFGTHLAAGGSSYNGSSGITITSDAASANTASTIVARDSSGNFSAGAITATGTNITSIPAANILSGALVNGMTATTQTALTSNTTLATTAYADSAVSAKAEQNYSCAVPLTTGVGAGTLTCFMKAARAFTVDNITATAVGTLVTVTPTLFECGTSTTCASSPITIGSGAVTAANTATPITVSSSAIAAGDYIAVELTAGTLTSVAVNLNVEMH